MALVRWQSTVQDENGNAVVNPSITVRNADDNSIADIFDDAGVAKANPFIGSIEGFVFFNAEPGKYLIEGVKGGQEAPDWIVDLVETYNGMIKHDNAYGNQLVLQSTSLPMIRLQNGTEGGIESTTRIQGVDYDHVNRQWFTTHGDGGDPEVTVVSLLNIDGTRVSTGLGSTVLGHGQDLFSFWRSGLRYLVSQNAGNLGASVFRYTAGAVPGSVWDLTLFSSSTYTTIGSNHRKDKLIAIGAHGSVFKIRYWDLDQITASGDYSNSYIHEISIDRTPFIVATNPVQSITSDDTCIYITSGNADIASPKYLNVYDIASGEFISQTVITARKDFAEAQNSGLGTEYEPQGTTWWFSRSTGHVMVQSFSMDQPTTSAGARNYALLLRPGRWSAVRVNGDDSPLGIGLMLEGGSTDIGYASGTRMSIGKVDNASPTPAITEVGFVPADDTFNWLNFIKATGFNTFSQSIADDTAAIIPLPSGGNGASLIAIVSGNNGTSYPTGIFKARTGGTVTNLPIAFADAAYATAPANIVFTTGVILTGTTGTDAKFNISVHSNGNLYLENRTGSTFTVSLLILGAG